jgi:hypothetical protein
MPSSYRSLENPTPIWDHRAQSGGPAVLLALREPYFLLGAVLGMGASIVELSRLCHRRREWTAFLWLLCAALAAPDARAQTTRSDTPVAQWPRQLLEEMTVEEKIGRLTLHSGSADGLHGEFRGENLRR